MSKELTDVLKDAEITTDLLRIINQIAEDDLTAEHVGIELLEVLRSHDLYFSNRFTVDSKPLQEVFEERKTQKEQGYA